MSKLSMGLAAVLLSIQLYAQEDKIVRKTTGSKREELNCTVRSATSQQVVYAVLVGEKMVDRKDEAEDVFSITLSENRNKEYGLGEDTRNEGNYEEAVRHFEKAASTDDMVVKQFAYYGAAECYLAIGKLDKAMGAVQALRNAVPDTYLIKRAFQAMYQAQRFGGDLKGAEQTIKEFEEESRKSGKPAWQKPAQMLRADLFEASNQPAEAIKIYRNFRTQNDEIGDEAKIGEMRCLPASKDWTILKERCEGIIRNSKDVSERLLVAAYNGLGDVQMNNGDAHEAALCYLRGVVELNHSGRTRENEASIAKASVALAKQGAALKDSDKKQEYFNRANRLLMELKQNYPSSGFLDWAQKQFNEATKEK